MNKSRIALGTSATLAGAGAIAFVIGALTVASQDGYASWLWLGAIVCSVAAVLLVLHGGSLERRKNLTRTLRVDLQPFESGARPRSEVFGWNVMLQSGLTYSTWRRKPTSKMSASQRMSPFPKNVPNQEVSL